MYNTATRTQTYTVLDVRKTFESFLADLRMISRRTEKWTQEYAEDVHHDVLAFAEAKYLSYVDISLMDANEKASKLRGVQDAVGHKIDELARVSGEMQNNLS